MYIVLLALAKLPEITQCSVAGSGTEPNFFEGMPLAEAAALGQSSASNSGRSTGNTQATSPSLSHTHTDFTFIAAASHLVSPPHLHCRLLTSGVRCLPLTVVPAARISQLRPPRLFSKLRRPRPSQLELKLCVASSKEFPCERPSAQEDKTTVVSESLLEKSLIVDEPIEVLQKHQLDAIVSSSEIHDALNNNALQELICRINCSPNPENELDKAMTEEAFHLFTDKLKDQYWDVGHRQERSVAVEVEPTPNGLNGD
ncbi:hypothetical protein PIB30_021619 [Stylosanthes scabra]|uniref:Uncharacterized protein n=1 Tax=Stylosanthes scabra TaxID=79078 RepID=A0ABU6WA36_9FABA|nr:hypothetical protein [Stylosanthes scabra]